jgi:hypothetical protein
MRAAGPVGAAGLVAGATLATATAATAATAGTAGTAASAQTPPGGVPGEPLIVLRTPIRLLDSRVSTPGGPAAKLQPGHSFGVTVPSLDGAPVVAAYLNVTITQTVGAGYLVVAPSDLSGERPLPPTSNINWSTSGVTLANLVLTAVGGENGVEVHAQGSGPTDVIVAPGLRPVHDVAQPAADYL